MKELKVGQVLEESFNGMSEFFEVTKVTPGTVTVAQLKWEGIPTPEGEDCDFVHRWVAIAKDENGNFKRTGKVFTKKKIFKGENFILKSCVYKGPYNHLYICDNPNGVFEFYWG